MLLHIPHSSTWIPMDYPMLPVAHLNQHTDWFTDELFAHPKAESFVFPYSRFYADMERLPNDPLETKGMGIFYTKTPWEVNYRSLSNPETVDVYALYQRWHTELAQCVEKTICTKGYAVLVDCHSFSQMQVDLPESELPDFNIGSNELTTSDALIDLIQSHLAQAGYSVAINFPYAYSVEPSKDAKHFETVMIEVNKRCYLSNTFEKSDGFAKVSSVLHALLEKIATYESALQFHPNKTMVG